MCFGIWKTKNIVIALQVFWPVLFWVAITIKHPCSSFSLLPQHFSLSVIQLLLLCWCYEGSNSSLSVGLFLGVSFILLHHLTWLSVFLSFTFLSTHKMTNIYILCEFSFPRAWLTILGSLVHESYIAEHTHAHTWATYPASVLRWSCQIPHDKIPILWRSWLSRPPCAESPTQSRQQDKSSGVRWDSSHAVCFIIHCDDSFWAPLLVAELIQN